MGDLLNIGDIIYYIDYEESNASYTIIDIRNTEKTSVFKGGLAYYVHDDLLSNATGYYPILVEEVDKENARFFSSPEKAHEAYEKFKSIIDK